MRTLEQLDLEISQAPSKSIIHVTMDEYIAWCATNRFLTGEKTFQVIANYARQENPASPIKNLMPQKPFEEFTGGFDKLSEEAAPSNPLDVQISGDHYKSLKIQPVEYIHANGIPFIEGCVIKYVSRWRNKGGLKDLEKAKHFIDLLIELETRSSDVPSTTK